jgi:dCTP deaminase
MLNWKEILTEIVNGFEKATPYFENSPDMEQEIKTIKTEIQKSDLKSIKDNKDVKRFFREHHISPEIIDEIDKARVDESANGDDGHSWILIDEVDPENLRPANYDMRLGAEVFVTAEKLPRRLTETESTIAIAPGEFGILMTYEYIRVPLDRVGMISLRFKYKNQGLVNISGFHVDPGFTGRIIFSVFNTGPRSVALRYKEAVFMIMFEELHKLDARSGYGGGSFSYQKHIPVDIITSLGGESVSVVKLNRRVRRLETELRILEALLIGMILAGLSYLAALFAHILPAG